MKESVTVKPPTSVSVQMASDVRQTLYSWPTEIRLAFEKRFAQMADLTVSGNETKPLTTTIREGFHNEYRVELLLDRQSGTLVVRSAELDV